MSATCQEEVHHPSLERLSADLTTQTTPRPPLITIEGSGTKNYSGTRVRVLVADDEQMIANTLALILTRSGFEARAVYSGRAALEAVVSFDPDVLISDVMMPEMTGIEVAIAVLAQSPRCQVLLFSGQAATADLLQEARAQGYRFEILAKPVHPADLLWKLRAGEFSFGVAS